MIDIRKLKELVKLMVENDLSELDLRDEQETVVVRRSMGGQFVPMAAPAMHAPVMHTHAPSTTPAAAASDTGDDSDDEAGLVAITSPMVGTFYAAADPGSPPFASPGTSVSHESIVCIVEAMKVFSEIKAECMGVVEKVLVKNGEPVEYGQKLFLVRPS
ncbi:MAG: acetyl-CoA carboxylase biotin carboxyl carrier protein [Phycisphaeraceae bacterium]|nr:acetyl-CoA carboxylase biotin carboxyl carrier protein [Phycisphaerales bacterium]MCB9843525.1 acetyl-CoA carboxylase biotin carboxyl carrier protein [Phycisphaeraceae bacterium]